MNVKIDINMDATLKFAHTLDKLHRSALPTAVRDALNRTAFDVKQNTMPYTAAATFTNRSPNFFKANSRVDLAKGWNVNNMSAKVGFISNNLKGSSNYAVEDLEEQEHGGTIDKKTFIPTDQARGGNKAKAVRPSNRLEKIKKKIVDSNKMQGRNKFQQFIKAAVTVGTGGYVISHFKKDILLKINSIGKASRGKGRTGLKVKATPLYSVKKNRSVHVKETDFMRTASVISGSKMDMFFNSAAQKQVDKFKKKLG
jgi:hypothetical protein